MTIHTAIELWAWRRFDGGRAPRTYPTGYRRKGTGLADGLAVWAELQVDRAIAEATASESRRKLLIGFLRSVFWDGDEPTAASLLWLDADPDCGEVWSAFKTNLRKLADDPPRSFATA